MELQFITVYSKRSKNVETYLQSKGESLPKRTTSPWIRDYRPETDVSPELTPTEASYFQSLIGVLRWIVKLGRVDITMEVCNGFPNGATTQRSSTTTISYICISEDQT